MKPIATVTLLLHLTVIPTSAWSQDWQAIPGTDSSFNPARIIRISSSVVRVWERYVLNDEALAYARRTGNSAEYADYAYSIALRQIDCVRRAHGFVTITNYTSSGSPAAPGMSLGDSEVKMEPAVPESNADALVAAVCAITSKKP